jgi:hypothetical protein
MILLLALDAAFTHVGDYRVDAVFIDNSHALGRQAQLDPAILGLFGRKRRRVLLFACDTLFPLTGFLPVT